jgi:hypothetical protein
LGFASHGPNLRFIKGFRSFVSQSTWSLKENKNKDKKEKLNEKGLIVIKLIFCFLLLPFLPNQRVAEAIFDLLAESQFRSLIVPVNLIEDLVEDTHPSTAFRLVVREEFFGIATAVTGRRKAHSFV